MRRKPFSNLSQALIRWSIIFELRGCVSYICVEGHCFTQLDVNLLVNSFLLNIFRNGKIAFMAVHIVF